VKFENVKKLSDGQFRRVTGVKRLTFNKMLEVVKENLGQKKNGSNAGRPRKLSPENMILMTLEYLREYRTYVHIGASYGLSESNTFENIRWVENVLVKCEEFKLPGKKSLLTSENEIEVILIDATETPIERPKKNKNFSTQEKRNAIQ